MTRKRSGGAAWLLGLALLFVVAAAFWLLSARNEQAQDAAMAGVPLFPEPNQVETHRPLAAAVAPPKPAQAPPRPPPRKVDDKLTAFVLAPSHNVTLIQVNALFNTPLFDRLKKCMPAGLQRLEQSAEGEGFDLERDLDRIAVVQDGFAMTGFFEGKPLAARFAGAASTAGSYKDTTIYTIGHTCFAQLGNLIVAGDAGQCEGLVDRALSPPPDADAASELYGDLYFRSDLTQYETGAGHDAQTDPLGALVGSLSGLTARANVWDDVALSVEGSPKDPGQLRDLTSMARGAMSVLKTQLEDGDERDQAFATLDNVKVDDGQLHLELALSADELIRRLHLCPDEAGAGAK